MIPMPVKKEKEIVSPFIDLLSTLLESPEWTKIDDREMLNLIMIRIQNTREIAGFNDFKDSLKTACPGLKPNWHSGFMDVFLYSLYSGQIPAEETTPQRLGNISEGDFDALAALYTVAGETIKPFISAVLSFIDDQFFKETDTGKITVHKKYTVKFLPEE